MKKLIREVGGLLVGFVAGFLLFGMQPTQTRSTVTDSVVQPASGQTAVQLDSQTGKKGHVEMKTQTTTSQAGKTVSRETSTFQQQQPARNH
ncbi:hypothetical protein FD30_GL001013 [Levilactobacillus namurensis DSM 19117]|uniref:Uncharacterized protein n=1 Tax=Levilactobacillus namurensis DSM 19117 TaxID=1423773 RepID=A0A0R1JMX2_9LACO|nr:hypothetical protein [Levilactobacillus namurensis]KRK72806.1 hypothetical protein FD30_GL001013 [Levilactobacillus namurensis DSM 19117]PTM23165.1 hypothetical protein DA798_04910 [Lactobacillus sp. PFC-70]GEO74828.1 hypothetical protein LNA02_15260 [Levilactobacillus namurensis]HJE44671.1 hypothetical protein [Levilactobacillus namurensis]